MEHLKSPSLVYLMWSFFDLMEWKNQSIEATTSSEHVFEIVASLEKSSPFCAKKKLPPTIIRGNTVLKIQSRGVLVNWYFYLQTETYFSLL